jgi:predicted metal-binding membrane protein
MRFARRQDWLMPIMLGLIGTAWAALVLWEQTPYGRYLDHGRWTDIGFAATICRVLPAGELVLPGLIYIGGWLLMTAAMMLPTVLPLARRFEAMTAGRHDRALLMALLVGGYLLAWLGFGVAAHALDIGLHALAQHTEWLIVNGWLAGACVLAIAGAFQFSRLKYRCLDQCRTPLSFIIRHWHGVAPRGDALRLGLYHGLYCVGCCWAIMLLMFVVGTGSVGWMLLLGAVMAIEKNAPWGKRLSGPLGFALIALAAIIVAGNLA